MRRGEGEVMMKEMGGGEEGDTSLGEICVSSQMRGELRMRVSLRWTYLRERRDGDASEHVGREGNAPRPPGGRAHAAGRDQPHLKLAVDSERDPVALHRARVFGKGDAIDGAVWPCA